MFRPGNVVDPVRIHQDSLGRTPDEERVMARACYVFDLGEWRRRHRLATEAKNYSELDDLDRLYECIGLP